MKRNHMKNTLKKIPKFKNEDAERDFWATHDTTEYIDWSKAKKVRFKMMIDRKIGESCSNSLPQGLKIHLSI